MSSSVPPKHISVRSSEPFAEPPVVAVADVPAGYDNGTILPAAYKGVNQPFYLTSSPDNLNVADTLAVGGEIDLNGGVLTVAGGELLLDGVPVGGGGGGAVTSVSGTAGQINAAPTTGAVVLSLPNVGTAQTIANVGSVQTDAQGRVVAATSLGYVPQSAADVAAAVAPKANLAGAVFTGAVDTTGTTLTVATPVAPAQAATKAYVDSAVAGGGVVVTAGVNTSVTGTPTNPVVNVAVSAPLNMNTQPITNSGNISAPTGATLDITGGEININQSGTALTAPAVGAFPFPTVMNINASGAVGVTAAGGVAIGGGGAVFVDAGAYLQMAALGPVSIGSGNLLGATTEIEHVAFKDNLMSNANAGEYIVMTGIDTITMQGDLNTVGDVVAKDLFGTDVIATGQVQGVTHVVGTAGAATTIARAADGTLATSATGVVGAGGVVDTLLNPTQLSLDGTNLQIKAKNAAGAQTVMSQVDIGAAIPGGLSTYTQVDVAAGGVLPVTAAQANSAIFIQVTSSGNLTVTLPNGVPDGTQFFIGLQYNSAADSQITVMPVGGGIGAGREVVIKAGNGGCLFVANGTVAGNVMYMPTDTGEYVALSGGNMTGPLTVAPTTNIEAKNITTALLTPLPDVGYISALGPLQVEGGNFLVANPAGSEIGLAASATPAPGEVATITYNYSVDDLLHVNKSIEAPGAVLDGNDVVPLLTFKDARTYFVSKQGADTNEGSANAPFLTIQAAVTAAIAAGQQAVLEIAPGTYAENITIPSVAGLVLQGTLASDRCVEGTIIAGTIAIQCNTTDNLNNNQVVIADCFVAGHIHDTSTKQHTLIVQNCRLEGNTTNAGQAVLVQSTATDMRTVVQNCIITQEAGTTGINAVVSANVGWLNVYECEITVRAEGCCIDVHGSCWLQRLSQCALASTSASGTPNALLFLNSTSSLPHAISLTTFAYNVATSKTAPGILATRPTAGVITATVANCAFALAGTLATGNVIQYGAGTSLVLLVAENRSLNTAAAAYASQIQSGATVLPLTRVGETSVTSVNGASGAITIAAGSGLSASTVGGTVTLTNTRTGVVESVTAGGAGISVTGTTANPVVNNTGVTRLIAGTNVSLTAETGSITISASGGGGGGGNVDSVSAGTGISLTGTSQDVIVNNAGVLSVGVGTGLVNTGTAQEPVIAISGTGTITTQDINAVTVDTTDLTSVNFPVVPGSDLPTQPRQLVPKAYVDGQSYGVQSVAAADASIEVGGTPSAVTLAVAASGVVGGTYTNATITVGADGRVSDASSGAAPVLSVSGTAGEIASTGGANPVLSLADTAVVPGAYTYAALTVDSHGRLTSAASGAAPVLSVTGVTGETTSTGGQNPAIGLADAGTAGTYTWPASVQLDAKGRTIAVVSGTQPITEVNAGAGISVSGVAGSATITNDGVRTLVAAPGDSSVTVGGTANAKTVALPAQTLAPGAYAWPAMTVNQKGIITAITENTVPFTSISAGSGIEVGGVPGAATITNTGVTSLNTKTGAVSILAGDNVTVNNAVSGQITISATTFPGTVTEVSGTAGQITVTNGTSEPVIGLATVSAPEASYSYPSAISFDDYGRLISCTSGTQTTVNNLGGNVTLAAGTNVTLDTVGNTITINSSGGGGGGVQSVSQGTGITVDNTDAANPIVSLPVQGLITPGTYNQVQVNANGIITFAETVPVGVLTSVVGGTNISINDTNPAAPIINLSGISGNATAPVAMGANELTSDTYIQAKDFLATTGYVGHWDGPGSFGNKWAIPYQDADAPGENSLRVVKLQPDLTEVPNTSAVLYSQRYNPLITTPFATAPSSVAPAGTTINNAGVDIVSGSIGLNSANWPTLQTSYYGILGNISLVTSTAQPLRFTVRGQITGKASTTFVAQYVSEGQYHTVPLNNISFGFGTNGQIAQGDTLTITVRCATITSLATTTIATAVPVLPLVLSPLTMAL